MRDDCLELTGDHVVFFLDYDEFRVLVIRLHESLTGTKLILTDNKNKIIFVFLN